MARHRTPPKCDKCGEQIQAKHWQPETFFCGDTFLGWDYSGHRCRLGVKYFIERMDDHRWYWDNGDKRISEHIVGWTDNPHKAMMFDSKEEADKYLLETIPVYRMPIEITEHLFLNMK